MGDFFVKKRFSVSAEISLVAGRACNVEDSLLTAGSFMYLERILFIYSGRVMSQRFS